MERARAWSPDGQRIALLAYDGCATLRCADTAEMLRRSWRIEFLDAATGRPVGDAIPVPGSAVELVAWRKGDPVVKRQSPEADQEKRHAALAAVSVRGGEQVLLTAPGGVSDLEVPGDLLDRAAFGGPEPRPSHSPHHRGCTPRSRYRCCSPSWPWCVGSADAQPTSR
ncbi:hypothetical protein [Micromonospora inositola]|uniref:hypothetical protein n=1 Tax=Micromonospora inositola TaxID=47865 RepID=UPI000B5B006E|nr:hypothetical protein [Micromonospora inositola]